MPDSCLLCGHLPTLVPGHSGCHHISPGPSRAALVCAFISVTCGLSEWMSVVICCRVQWANGGGGSAVQSTRLGNTLCQPARLYGGACSPSTVQPVSLEPSIRSDAQNRRPLWSPLIGCPGDPIIIGPGQSGQKGSIPSKGDPSDKANTRQSVSSAFCKSAIAFSRNARSSAFDV